jgi:hypothetical protein
MRSRLAERLAANAKVAAVLNSIPAPPTHLNLRGGRCRIKCIKTNHNIEFNGKNKNILVIFGNSYLQTKMEEINSVV